ncbi:MAG: hypothetical protein ABUS57_05915 [Pseudomonadota bacterium]
MSEEKMWFAPKRFGYGAGLPIAWEGWAALAAYSAVIGAGAWAAFNLVRNDIAQLEVLAIAVLVPTAVLIWLAQSKTRGGWRWRWGDDD